MNKINNRTNPVNFKVGKKKTRKILILISMLQILLLINFIFVNSYSYSVFLGSFLSIKQIGIVSAEDEQENAWCCTDNCQNYNSEPSSEECDNFVPNSCEETSSCRTGTCYDRETGTCSVSTRGECEDGEGQWYDADINEVDECKKGCCTWGNEKRYSTETQCEVLSGDDDNWDDSVTEIECRFLRQVEGACVLETGLETTTGKTCRLVTEEQCISELGGDFHEGFLCSNPGLVEEGEQPICEKQDRINCIEGKDEIYWFDSCGNLENIYSSNKDASWNNGMVLSKGESCELNLDNPSSVSSCGNCDSLTNSICADSVNPKVTDGNFVCKDLRCHEGDKVFDSGESWCAYENYIGNTNSFSADIPGTLHWRKSCVNGEIKTDNCDNSRTKICSEHTISEEGDEKKLAQCRVNNGWKCGAISMAFPDYDGSGNIKNQAEIDEARAECDNTLDCWAKKINVDKYFMFDVCVPKYAPGLNPDTESARNRCDVASLTCTAIEVKELSGWVCKENCECLNHGFAEQMNDLCISLGDCGGYINIKGDYTKNFRVDGYDSSNYNGDVSSTKKAEYLGVLSLVNALSNLPAYVYDATQQGTYGDDVLGALEGSGEDLGKTLKDALTIIGIVGVATTGLGGIAGLIGSSAAVTALVAAGGVNIWNPIGWILGGIGVFVGIATGVAALLGLGETREITIDFKCQPWQPPVGGANCGACDDNILIPCTEYKCKSLGGACNILEVYDSPNPVCVNAYSGDNTPPIIGFGEIENSYSHTERTGGNGVEIKTADRNCIPEFTPINFSLITENEAGEDEYSICTYEWQHEEPSPADDYSNVIDGESFEEGNSYSTTHNAEITLPSVTSNRVYDISGNDITGRTGKLSMYVRCRDHAGNFNFNEYIVNFCLKSGRDNTPATIKKYTPESGSYLAFGDTDNPLEIKLSEPADCRWTSETDKGYNEMTDFSTCEDYAPEEIKSRWSCSTTLTGLSEPTNSIFIKCNDTNGNINEDGFHYVLYSTSNELEISSIFPQGAIMRGGNLFDINLEATTSGGAYNGESGCSYDFITPDWGGDVFAQTTAFHEYNFPALASGDYNISVECEDEAGNAARGNSVFSLQVDETPPIITRAYKEVDEDKLKIMTNERARCYYSLENCNFNFDDEGVAAMSPTLSTEHTAGWNLWEVYHIKCEDIWEKKNTGCAIVVTPAFI